jgi:hypothetical protein
MYSCTKGSSTTNSSFVNSCEYCSPRRISFSWSPAEKSFQDLGAEAEPGDVVRRHARVGGLVRDVERQPLAGPVDQPAAQHAAVAQVQHVLPLRRGLLLHGGADPRDGLDPIEMELPLALLQGEFKLHLLPVVAAVLALVGGTVPQHDGIARLLRPRGRRSALGEQCDGGSVHHQRGGGEAGGAQ